MADKKSNTENGATKEKKEFAPRKSAKQVVAERGKKGVVSVMTRIAFNLAHAHKFEGTGIETRDPKTNELVETKRQNGAAYLLSRENGIIDKLDEKGETWKNVLAKAKAAKADLEHTVDGDHQPKYSKAVQAFIKELLKLKAPAESAADALKGMSLD